jgi:hypothetical protein
MNSVTAYDSKVSEKNQRDVNRCKELHVELLLFDFRSR